MAASSKNPMVLQHARSGTIHFFNSHGNTGCGHGGGGRDVEDNYRRRRLETAQKQEGAKLCNAGCKKLHP
jgi:hypothetical protein